MFFRIQTANAGESIKPRASALGKKQAHAVGGRCRPVAYCVGLHNLGTLPRVPATPSPWALCRHPLRGFNSEILFLGIYGVLPFRIAIRFIPWLLLVCVWLAQSALAQAVDARAYNVRGLATLSSAARSGKFPLRKFDVLKPGDMIETDATGRVVISLSDGSLITVLPNSRIVLKDFRQAVNLRELLEVLLGRVRVKIHHLGKRPNPYRVNSPVASIAVRGTEFIVAVQASTETWVAVLAGLVEVTPLTQPGNRRLLERGRSIVVRPGGDIGSLLPSALNGLLAGGGQDFDPVNRLASTYQRSVDAIVQNSSGPLPTRFAAFPDAQLDSLDNPAYAGGLRQAQGRVLLLPSVSSPAQRTVNLSSPVFSNTGFPDQGNPHRFDYTLAPQLTFFTPVADSRVVIGGGVFAARTNLQALTLYEPLDAALARVGAINLTNPASAGAAIEATAINSAFVIARRFGSSERTNLGLKVEHLTGAQSFLNVSRAAEAALAGGTGIESQTDLGRTRVTLGLTQDFAGERKLGVYARYGVTMAEQNDFLRLAGRREVAPFETRETQTRAWEAGLRWRAPLVKKWFYGVESAVLWERGQSERRQFNTALRNESAQSRRMSLGGGLGYQPRSQTVISLDMAGGRFRTIRPDLPVGLTNVPVSAERGHFLAGHLAAQHEWGRHVFASASLLTLRQSQRLAFQGLASASSWQRNSVDFYSTLGLGWKFTPRLAAQYLISTDHRGHAPSHALLLRYNFELKNEH